MEFNLTISPIQEVASEGKERSDSLNFLKPSNIEIKQGTTNHLKRKATDLDLSLALAPKDVDDPLTKRNVKDKEVIGSELLSLSLQFPPPLSSSSSNHDQFISKLKEGDASSRNKQQTRTSLDLTL